MVEDSFSSNVELEWLDERVIKATSSDPLVTINKKSGRIYFNAAAVAKLGKDTVHVRIGLDNTNHILGIKPLAEKETGSFSLSQAGGRQHDYLGRNLNSKSLVRKIFEEKQEVIDKDNAEDSYKFPAKWLEDKELLLIDLTEKIE